jgi:hypothetical protein
MLRSDILNPRRHHASLQLFAMIGFLLGGCGMVGTSNPSNSCAAGTAEIQVYDNGLRRVCGCTEASNVPFGPGQTLQCTVPVGTRLFVNYVGITSRQAWIRVSLMPGWETAVMNPSSGVQTGVILLNSTGTFSFSDAFQPTLSGTLVVN